MKKLQHGLCLGLGPRAMRSGLLVAVLGALGCGDSADQSAGFAIGQGEGDRYADLADIPVEEVAALDFEVPEADTDPDAPLPPPCSTCAELNMHVDDINQRANFALTVGGGNPISTTRVIWTLIIPFNSDQLFVQPYAGSASGAYTNLHINNFEPNTPIEFRQTLSQPTPIGRLAMSIGSSGAWTGDMTMQVFVDSVTLETEDGTTRVLDADLEGFTALGSSFEPEVQFHP